MTFVKVKKIREALGGKFDKKIFQGALDLTILKIYPRVSQGVVMLGIN